jgi:PAS domain S-box-containing protein
VLRFFTCLTVDHDWRLVLVAGLVCAAATFTAFRLYGLAQKNHGSLRGGWVAITGIAAGCGIWATHFIAMLAYRPGLATGYEPIGTVGSLILAVVVTSAGFGIAARRQDLLSHAIGGAFLGVGIAGMHYVGMAAFRTQGHLAWSTPYLVSSVLISILMSIPAVVLAGRAATLKTQALGGGLFTLAICGMHFTGMTAVTIVPDPTVAVPDAIIDRSLMVAAVTGLATIIGLTSIAVAMIERWSGASALTRLRATIEAMPNGVAIMDADDRFVAWNSLYAEIWGLEPDRLSSKLTFAEVLTERVYAGDVPDAVGQEEAWLAQRLKDHRETSIVREQRGWGDRWVRIQEGRTVDGGVIAVCTDLTDLRHAADALAAARDEAEAANRAKSQFLATMSHELRTPLNGVIGMADLLAASGLSSRERKIVEIIQTSGATLEHLVSDILDFGRIEAGRLALEPAPFRLEEAVDVVVELCALKLERSAVALDVRIAPEAKGWFLGDAGRVKQVLTNLLSNAIKFTPRGEIVVEVSAPAAGGVSLAVRDTGVGFDSRVRERIFGRFEQGDASITRRFGGSGLGLAISRQLAELMGGELQAESEPGRGSTFTLILPLRRAEAPAAETPAAEEVPADVPAANRLRVLLADDHPVNRRVVELMLDAVASELVSVENGAEAVAAFERGDFDVVLMDMMMPVMDGLAATRAIRALEHERGAAPTPVVMLTANALAEHVAAARDAGADTHLSKPVGAVDLLATLDRLTTEPRRRSAA